MKRIFIAVKVVPGSEMLRVFSSIKSLLVTENIKWVDPVNIHLTLAFLGDTEEKRIKSLAVVLKEKCSGFKGFDFTLVGTGLFKSYRDPKIIWAGISSSEQLSGLNTLVNDVLKENGFECEERPFQPHLTLGRIRSLGNPKNMKTVIEKYRDYELQKVEVKELILFESILMHTGPLYKPLGKFPLL
jgi:RNA 2',3'-cyclic 3'-phosphodiesterase